MLSVDLLNITYNMKSETLQFYFPTAAGRRGERRGVAVFFLKSAPLPTRHERDESGGGGSSLSSPLSLLSLLSALLLLLFLLFSLFSLPLFSLVSNFTYRYGTGTLTATGIFFLLFCCFFFAFLAFH